MFGKNIATSKKAKLIMIIEDDALLAQVLEEEFIREKFDVISIADGSLALDAIKENHPDLILLDLILPGLDGFAILKHLKSDLKTKDIPVIVISNLQVESDVKSAKSLGAEEYLIKSNTAIEEIIKSVQKYLA